MTSRKTWLIVVLFAAAMAWMESATVVYLRLLVGRVQPYQANPLPLAGHLYPVEMVREAATMVMLFAAGCLAGRTTRSRLGYMLVAFGVWDILYYVFLAVVGGWPRSVWDWDVLFLLPVPWWGPVLAPVAIAALMIAGGTLVSQLDDPKIPAWPGRQAWALNGVGCCLALFVFMSDSLRASARGVEAMRTVLPTVFHWPSFVLALILIAVPVVDLATRMRRFRERG